MLKPRRIGGRRHLFGALAVAALAVAALAVGIVPSASTAAPSEEDVETAREKLEALEHEFETVVERYNHARYLLSENEAQLADAKAQMQQEATEADIAIERLEERVAASYMNMGSQFDSILSAGSLAEFSDRLEFLSAVSVSDVDVAAQADAARQRAE